MKRRKRFKDGVVGMTFIDLAGTTYEIVRAGFTVLGTPQLSCVPLERHERRPDDIVPPGTKWIVGWQECGHYIEDAPLVTDDPSPTAR